MKEQTPDTNTNIELEKIVAAFLMFDSTMREKIYKIPHEVFSTESIQDTIKNFVKSRASESELKLYREIYEKIVDKYDKTKIDSTVQQFLTHYYKNKLLETASNVGQSIEKNEELSTICDTAIVEFKNIKDLFREKTSSDKKSDQALEEIDLSKPNYEFSDDWYALKSSIPLAFEPGKMSLITGKTSTGKTSFVIDVVNQFIKRKQKILFITSSEISDIEMLHRLICFRIQIPYKDLKNIPREKRLVELYEIEKYVEIIDSSYFELKWSVETRTDLFDTMLFNRNDVDLVVLDSIHPIVPNFFPVPDQKQGVLRFIDLLKKHKKHGIVTAQIDNKMSPDKLPGVYSVNGVTDLVTLATLIVLLDRDGLYSVKKSNDTAKCYVLKQTYGPVPLCFDFKWNGETATYSEPSLTQKHKSYQLEGLDSEIDEGSAPEIIKNKEINIPSIEELDL